MRQFEALQCADLAPDIVAAVWPRLFEGRLGERLTQAHLEGEEPLVSSEELVVLTASGSVGELVGTFADAEGTVWRRDDRTRAMQKRALTLQRAWDEAQEATSEPFALFDLEALESAPTARGRELLSDFHCVDAGLMITFGSTFTPHHVEDYAMANIATLAPTGSGAMKIWLVERNPTRGIEFKRALYRELTAELVKEADVVLFQMEGDTVMIPALAYHAVYTLYPTKTRREDRQAILTGVFYADTSEGSVWRERLLEWDKRHQTGYRHGSGRAVHEVFQPFLERGETKARPRKKLRAKEKARLAVSKRWAK